MPINRNIAGLSFALALVAPLAFSGPARADCGPAAKETLGDSSTGPTVPDTPSSGVASDRRQMASARESAPQAGNPHASDHPKDALGHSLDPGTGTTVPGTPSHGAGSDRQKTANTGQGAVTDRDCR
jgi:hypothetical protein